MEPDIWYNENILQVLVIRLANKTVRSVLVSGNLFLVGCTTVCIVCLIIVVINGERSRGGTATTETKEGDEAGSTQRGVEMV